MRLVCPSCASEYEVMAAAIGAKGRNVRCANCAHEWFQAPEKPEKPAPEPEARVSKQIVTPRSEGAEPKKAGEPIPEPVAARPSPPPVPEPKASPSAGVAALGAFAAASEPPATAPAPAPEPEMAAAPEAAPVADAGETPAQRLARVSMPDFENEPAARSIDAPPQDQIYFDEDPIAARSSAIEETPVAAGAPGGATRPDDLAASMRQLEEDTTSGGGGAFLAGFATVTLLSLIAIAAYVKAPDLAAMAPALESPLNAYSALVDSGRMALAAATGG